MGWWRWWGKSSGCMSNAGNRWVTQLRWGVSQCIFARLPLIKYQHQQNEHHGRPWTAVYSPRCGCKVHIPSHCCPHWLHSPHPCTRSTSCASQAFGGQRWLPRMLSSEGAFHFVPIEGGAADASLGHHMGFEWYCVPGKHSLGRDHFPDALPLSDKFLALGHLICDSVAKEILFKQENWTPAPSMLS